MLFFAAIISQMISHPKKWTNKYSIYHVWLADRTGKWKMNKQAVPKIVYKENSSYLLQKNLSLIEES